MDKRLLSLATLALFGTILLLGAVYLFGVNHPDEAQKLLTINGPIVGALIGMIVSGSTNSV